MPRLLSVYVDYCFTIISMSHWCAAIFFSFLLVSLPFHYFHFFFLLLHYCRFDIRWLHWFSPLLSSFSSFHLRWCDIFADYFRFRRCFLPCQRYYFRPHFIDATLIFICHFIIFLHFIIIDVDYFAFHYFSPITYFWYYFLSDAMPWRFFIIFITPLVFRRFAIICWYFLLHYHCRQFFIDIVFSPLRHYGAFRCCHYVCWCCAIFADYCIAFHIRWCHTPLRHCHASHYFRCWLPPCHYFLTSFRHVFTLPVTPCYIFADMPLFSMLPRIAAMLPCAPPCCCRHAMLPLPRFHYAEIIAYYRRHTLLDAGAMPHCHITLIAAIYYYAFSCCCITRRLRSLLILCCWYADVLFALMILPLIISLRINILSFHLGFRQYFHYAIIVLCHSFI